MFNPFVRIHKGFQHQRVERYQFMLDSNVVETVPMELKQGDVIDDIFIRQERPEYSSDVGIFTVADEDGDVIYDTSGNAKFDPTKVKATSKTKNAPNFEKGAYDAELFANSIRIYTITYTPASLVGKAGKGQILTHSSLGANIVSEPGEVAKDDTPNPPTSDVPEATPEANPSEKQSPTVMLEVKYTPYYLYDT